MDVLPQRRLGKGVFFAFFEDVRGTMKRDLAKNDDKLITQLWAILDGADAPETRIGQARALLERESETGKTPGRSSWVSESSLYVFTNSLTK